MSDDNIPEDEGDEQPLIIDDLNDAILFSVWEGLRKELLDETEAVTTKMVIKTEEATHGK